MTGEIVRIDIPNSLDFLAITIGLVGVVVWFYVLGLAIEVFRRVEEKDNHG